MARKSDLPITEWFQLGSKEGAQAKEDYIRNNADYFRVVWREFPVYKGARYPKETNIQTPEERQKVFDDACFQAQFAAKYLAKPVMVYGVIGIPGTENGYDSLVEVIQPT